RPAPPVAGQPDSVNWVLGLYQIADWLTGPDGALWYCRSSVEYADGTGSIGKISHATTFVGVNDPALLSIEFAAPFPSPARDRVELAYTLSAPARAELAIYDVTGRRVRNLVQSPMQPAGRHQL